jgi:hypothetical protein
LPVEITEHLQAAVLRGSSDELARLRKDKMKEYMIHKAKAYLLGSSVAGTGMSGTAFADTYTVDKNSKPVIQYDLIGNFIKEFGSIKEASYILGIDKQKLDNHLQTPKVKLDNGIILKYKNITTPRKGKIILCFDENWNFISEYPSINQAQRDLNVVGIIQFLRGKSNYVGKNKYKFKYK